MKKTDLRAKTVKALKTIAQRLGIRGPASQRKDDLIHEIILAQKLLDRRNAGPRKTAAAKPSPRKAPAAKAARAPVSSTSPRTSRRRAAAVSQPPVSPVASPLPLPVAMASPLPIAEHKYETPTHSQPHNGSPYDNLGELPDSYGSGRLFFVARDPNWIYATWDFSWHQLEEMRHQARGGELKLRVHSGTDTGGPVIQDITLNPSSRDWFVRVEHPSADYCAELGWYDHDGRFVARGISRPARTPSDRMSGHTDARFVTIPFHISFRELFDLVKKHFHDGEELADVLHRLQMAGFAFPFDYPRPPTEGSPDMEVLSGMFGGDLIRRIRMGSEVLVEWLQHRLFEESSSGLFLPGGASSGAFQAPAVSGFWVKVNAELIIHGVTDPRARVAFDGREIALKPDGTFRFQFALPDGKYRVPITATSPDGAETREIHLEFVRATATQGEVGESARENEETLAAAR